MARKSWLILLLVAVSTVMFGGSARADSALTGWHKGVLVQPANSTDYASSNFQQSMRNVAANGANYVTLVIPLQQTNIYSSDVRTSGDTPTDASLVSGINYIRSLGMNVSITLHDNPQDRQWRAFINPTDRNAWFYNYGLLVNHYGDIGQANGAAELVIGTEMSSLTNPNINSANTAGWNGIIFNARTHFKGLMTYSAQHGGYMGDAKELGFWPALDEIGISAYYGMGNRGASVADMKAKWSQIDANELKQLATTYNKPIIFTEVGYVSGTNSLSDPGSAYSNPGSPDMTDQANAYEALLQYWSGSSYFRGVQFWDWSTNPAAGGSNDTGYTPQGKTAEQVMKRWFSGGGTPATATPAAYTTTSPNGSATVGKSITTPVNVSASQSVTNVIVDLEIYDSTGKQVAQQFMQNQNLTATPTAYQITWTPAQAGQYTVKAGVFTGNWQSNLYWNGSVAAIAAATSTNTPTSSPSPTSSPTPMPSPTPAPTPAPTPSPTPQPAPATTTVNIWWPSNGSAVSGVQPFKALIDGRDLDSYALFWQVDGGQLNPMTNNLTDGAHKQADVDLSSWNWHGPGGQYIVTFVAKDLNGAVINQRSTTITVN